MAAGSTLTLLFTDLVGSTELATREGNEAAQAVRRAHDRLLTEQFASFGGTVVKNTGDGFFVSFPSARQGVECAAALQRAIAIQHAEGRYLDLLVRAGLHTGEPVEERGDLFGSDVALASRIMDEAAGGDVFVSETTYLLARAHTKLRFAPEGERRLKGFPEPVTVFRVATSGLGAPGVRRLSRLVGRVQEHERLRRRLDAALRGSGSTVLIAGEPGVGKTRLMSELAFEARDAGVTVLSGRAFETEGLPPYHAFTDALAGLTRGRTAGDLRSLLADDAAEIAKLLPELWEVMPEIVRPGNTTDDSDRYRLFDAILGTLIRCAATAPVLLTLDDLHWSDRATVHLVQHLARHIANVPVLIVATYRDAEVPRDHPLVAFVDELDRAGLGERLTVSPLSRTDAETLVADVLGEPPMPGAADALYSAAAGNPFFTEELARQIHESAGTGGSPPPIPDTVRHVLTRRYERLSAPTRDIVLSCVVLGSHLSPERLAAVGGRSDEDVLGALEEALAARVLREDGASFSFTHPLVPEVLYRDLSAPRRRLLHHRTALGLEQLYGGESDTHVQELAHHFLAAAADGSEVAKAIGYARRAAEHALRVYAYEDAATYYQRSLVALGESAESDPAERCELLLALGAATMRSGDAPAADATFWRAAEVARSLARGDLLGRAALGVGDARRTGGIVDDPLIGLFRDSLALLPVEDSPLRARLTARYVWSLYHVEPLPVLATQAGDAIEMARRIGDPHTLLFVLRSVLQFRHDPLDLDRRLADSEELRRLAGDLGDRSAMLFVMQNQISLRLQTGDIAQADATIAEFGRVARELRQPYYLWLHAVYLAMRALFDGRFDEAEALAQEAFALGRAAQSETNLAFQFLAVELVLIRWEQGRLGELADVVANFVEQYPALRWRSGLAFVQNELGDEVGARAEYERLFAGDQIDIPDDFNQLFVLTVVTELCTRFNDARGASLLYERVSPFRGRNVTIGAPAACVGAACRFLAMLAGTKREWAESATLFEQAIVLNERMGAVPMLARTQFEYARMLIRSGDGAAVPRARELLAVAEASGKQLGMARLEFEIEALRREAGF